MVPGANLPSVDVEVDDQAGAAAVSISVALVGLPQSGQNLAPSAISELHE
jgi:hypothetical protein